MRDCPPGPPLPAPAGPVGATCEFCGGWYLAARKRRGRPALYCSESCRRSATAALVLLASLRGLDAPAHAYAVAWLAARGLHTARQ